MNIADMSTESLGKLLGRPDTTGPTAADGAKSVPAPVEWEKLDDWEVMKKAYNQKNKRAWDEIRRRTKGDTDRFIRLGFGDLEHLHEVALLSEIAHGDLNREAIAANIDRMAADLKGPNPTALEKLLINRILMCWLYLQWREQFLVTGTGDAPARREYVCRMFDRAHKRYLASIKALAQLRKLNLPSITIVTSQGGPQQVNLEPADTCKQVGAQVEAPT
jgi:hypothetical protein